MVPEFSLWILVAHRESIPIKDKIETPVLFPVFGKQILFCCSHFEILSWLLSLNDSSSLTEPQIPIAKGERLAPTQHAPVALGGAGLGLGGLLCGPGSPGHHGLLV